MRKLTCVLIIMAVLFAAGACMAAKQAPQAGAKWWGKPPAQTPAPGQPASFPGKVTAVSSTSITLQLKDGAKTFAVTAKTKVKVHGERATIADVKVGDPAVVRAAPVNGTLTAVGIMVPQEPIGGKVTAIQGNTITAVSKDNKEIRVTVGDSTKYVSHNVQGAAGYIGTFADVRLGYLINVRGEVKDGVVWADAISFTPAVARGTVVAVDGNLVTLKTKRQMTIQVQVSDATQILVRPRVSPNVKGTLADVKVGTPADIGYHVTESGSAPLLWIDLLTGM